jgi:hypothetical protein
MGEVALAACGRFKVAVDPVVQTEAGLLTVWFTIGSL